VRAAGVHEGGFLEPTPHNLAVGAVLSLHETRDAAKSAKKRGAFC
jgi:hypothetical protein